VSPRQLLQAVGADPTNGAGHDAKTKAGRHPRVVLVFHPDRDVREGYCELLESEGQTAAPVGSAETAMTLMSELKACGTEAVLLAPVAAEKAPAPPRNAPAAGEPRSEAVAPARPLAEAEAPSVELVHAEAPARAAASDPSGERARPSSEHICSWCKRVRQPDGAWLAAHLYVGPRRRWSRLRPEPTHGICDDCYDAALAQLEGAS
jgi:hypothetical protein